MDLPNTGFDPSLTYFEHNLRSKKIPNIFIHGVGLNNKMWLPQKKYFQNKEIIFYDLLNHGKSKKGYYELNFEDFIKQLDKLVKFLNIEKFNLIGFSIGALIAQHYAEQYYAKINKLIVISSVYKRSNKQIATVKNRYNMALQGKSITNDSINRWFNKEYLETNKNTYDFFFNILESKSNKDFLPAYKVFVESENYELDFSNFNIPTLIMTGENDIGSTTDMSKMINQKIKNSELYIIPNSKHMATYEKSDLINAKIDSFIS